MKYIGALIIRIGFWGPLYYNYDKEPPKWHRYLFRRLYYMDRTDHNGKAVHACWPMLKMVLQAVGGVEVDVTPQAA